MTTTTPPPLDLNDVQGDIIGGFPKKSEVYFFFQITNADLFKSQLAHFVPLVKSSAQVMKDRKDIEEHKRQHPGDKKKLLPIVGVNVAFSAFGLRKLSIAEQDITDLADPFFSKGQLADAKLLGDKGAVDPNTGTFTPDLWSAEFRSQIDGIIDIAGDSHANVEKKLKEVKKIFGVGPSFSSAASIKEVTEIWGKVRPDENDGHEHFGFMDGISNPQINGIDDDTIIPGQEPKPVPVGSLLMGRGLDPSPRPSWALDGSFLVFRHLYQLVPEFNEFLRTNPIDEVDGVPLTEEERSELLGARLVGRWKSGAPVVLAPFKDNPELAKANNFNFTPNDQKLCPFAAHVRKTLPRADLEVVLHNDKILENRRIMRRGIPFGPEVTPKEEQDKQTHHGRGLLFACYQSSIVSAFHFIQESWANTKGFPIQTTIEPGIDAIIGQAGGEVRARSLTGTDPDELAESLPVPLDFVVPRGGEYFFAPSIKVLKNTFASAA